MTGRPGGRKQKGRPGNPVTRTGELAKKREQRSFRFRLVAFLGVILILVLVAGYQFWLRDSSLVSIKNLEIVGVNTKTEEGRQIDQAVRTAMGEMTTLNVKPEVLDQELDRYPRVADATVETSIPDSATVTLTVREDGSILGDGADALLIATDGTVLGPAGGQEESLPSITPVEKDDPTGKPAAGTLLTGRELNQALILGAAPPELRSFVEGGEPSRLGVVVQMQNGPTLLFGDSSHVDEKWRTTAALIADPSFDTSSYVDLSVPRRPAVSAEPPSGESAQTVDEAP